MHSKPSYISDVRISDVQINDINKTKKLFFSASERPRTVLNAFLECLYLAIYRRTSLKYTDVAYMAKNTKSCLSRPLSIMQCVPLIPALSVISKLFTIIPLIAELPLLR